MPIVLPHATQTWYQWNNSISTTATTASTTFAYYPSTWTQWTGTTTSTITVPSAGRNYVWNGWVTDYAQTEAQREELRRRQDEAQARRERESRERLAKAKKFEGAQPRALELLEMLLTPEEKLLRERHDGDIYVRGSEGGLFVIELRSSVHGNVRKVDEHGCQLGRLCAAPSMYDEANGYGMPLADGWVGQYLTLKHNEGHFTTKANWSGRRECAHPGVPMLGAERIAA